VLEQSVPGAGQPHNAFSWYPSQASWELSRQKWQRDGGVAPRVFIWDHVLGLSPRSSAGGMMISLCWHGWLVQDAKERGRGGREQLKFGPPGLPHLSLS
jgi:hypothetical protein